MNKRDLFVLVLVVIVIFVSGCDITQNQIAEKNDTIIENSLDNYTAKYDPEILEAFKNQEWIKVTVKLKDKYNILITGTKEERRLLSRKIDEWFEPVINDVLVILSKEEYKQIGTLSDGFYGIITKKGFDKLIKDKRIDKIYLSGTAYATTNGTLSNNNSPTENVQS